MPKSRLTSTLAAALLTACGAPDPAGPPQVERPVTTVLGSGEPGYRGGTALEARLAEPMDAAFGPDGRLYVADWGNHRIRAVDLQGGDVEDVAGSGLPGDEPGRPAALAALLLPASVAFAPDGSLFIAAWQNSKIRRIDPASGTIEDVAGTGRREYSGDGGPAALASLDLPTSLAFREDGSFFFLDQQNQVIRQVDVDGVVHRTAGRCVTLAPCDDGELPAPCPPPSNMEACGLDGEGCGFPCGPAFADGTALDVRMSQPFGASTRPAGRLALGPDGALYFTDTGNHLVRRIDLSSGAVTTVAGRIRPDGAGGVRGNAAAEVPALGAELSEPVDLELDAGGDLYFTDTGNSCVRKVSRVGTLSTVVGVCGTAGFNGDGRGAPETLLDRPHGLALHDGALFVVDTFNRRVRRVELR